MKNLSKIISFLELILTLVFLLQSLKFINIIPTNLALSVIGESSDPIKIVFGAFFTLLSFFVIGFIIEILYFGKEKRRLIIQNLYRRTAQAFLTVWVTFFVGGFLSAFKIFPLAVGKEYLDFYLFWFLIINYFSRRIKIRPIVYDKNI